MDAGSGPSPLRRAIRCDQAPVVAVLLGKGARFGRRRDEPLGMLGWAMAHNAHATLPLLVAHQRARGRQSAALAILSTAHSPAFMTTLTTGEGLLPDNAEHMLWHAARVGHADAVALFLGAGVTPGRRHRMRWPGTALPDTRGPARLEAGVLQVAALGGHTQVIAALVAHNLHRPLDAAAFYTAGASAAPQQLGALGLAISQGHGRAMWALIEAGAGCGQARHTGSAWQSGADLALACGHIRLRPLLWQVERLQRQDRSPARVRSRWCGLVPEVPATRQTALLRRQVEALAREFAEPEARAQAPVACTSA